MPLSPQEMRAWQGFCLTAVQKCQASANDLMREGRKGRASWFMLGVQTFGQLGNLPAAAESYIGILEDWTEMGEDRLFVHMCRYMADGLADPEHYFYLVLHKIADMYHVDEDPADEQSEVPFGDWIDQVFLDAGAALVNRLEGHAEGCGCSACRSTATAARAWWQDATTDPR